MKALGFEVAAALVFTAPVALAHEHGGETHASNAKECKKGAKDKTERKVCLACVKQEHYHYHLDTAVQGDRCHDDNNDPEAKKQ
jgi:hypothetical protein